MDSITDAATGRVLELSVRWNLLELFSDLILEMNDQKMLSNDFLILSRYYKEVFCRKGKNEKLPALFPGLILF